MAKLDAIETKLNSFTAQLPRCSTATRMPLEASVGPTSAEDIEGLNDSTAVPDERNPGDLRFHAKFDEVQSLHALAHERMACDMQETAHEPAIHPQQICLSVAVHDKADAHNTQSGDATCEQGTKRKLWPGSLHVDPDDPRKRSAGPEHRNEMVASFSEVLVGNASSSSRAAPKQWHSEGHENAFCASHSEELPSGTSRREGSFGGRQHRQNPEVLGTPAASEHSSTAVAKTSSFEQVSSRRLSGSSSRTSGRDAHVQKIQSTIEAARSNSIKRSGHIVWMAKLWQFIENPYSGRYAYTYSIFIPLFIGSSVSVSFIQTIESRVLEGVAIDVMQGIFESFFALELIVRFTVCPYRRSFFTSVFNWIDIISAMPLLLRVGVMLAASDSGKEMLSVVAVVPVLRLLKLTRRFEKFQLLLSAFEIAFEALPVLLYTLMLIALIFSALLYFAEQDNLGSLPKALWFTIVTMTTVGYGDITPNTPWGSMIAVGLMIISALYMAIPIGIVGNAFSQVWGDRDRLLLMHRVREAFLQGGFTPAGLLEIFSMFDTDGSGDIDIEEFEAMLAVMQINIGSDRVRQLFFDLDEEGEGCIKLNTMIRVFFPGFGGGRFLQKLPTLSFALSDDTSSTYIDRSDKRRWSIG